MTRDEVEELLEEIEHLDTRRTFDERQVEAWRRVAVQAGWDLAAALAAVTAHYAESKTWIMPADVTAGIRARRTTNPWAGTRWV